MYYFISVNHKTEDDILRSLNRLAQRKLLDSLSAVRPESSVTAAVSDEQLKRYGLFRIKPLLITGQGRTGQEKKIEIHLPNGPVNFSFHLPLLE